VSAPGPPAVVERLAVPAGTSAADAVAAARLPLAGPGAIVVVRTPDGRLRDLAWVADADVEVDPVAVSSPDGLDVLRHSTAHVLAQAVQDLFPEARLGIGPPIEHGFYYDFDVARPFQPDDLDRVEARMREIVKAGQRFARRVLPSREAARSELAEESYKLELLEDMGDVDAEGMEVGGGELTIYDNLDARTGQRCWGDLCRARTWPRPG
jgi:threonyl-tRNA synthetase